MGARHAFLGPTNVQDGMGEIHLIPVQVREFGRSETVAEGDKDHGAVTMTPAVTLRLASRARKFSLMFTLNPTAYVIPMDPG